MRHYTQPPPSVDKQFALLKIRNPSGKGAVRHGKLTWHWKVQPTPISRAYDGRIEYSMHSAPKVFIESPNLLEIANGRRIPHLYNHERIQICLYLPNAGEWSSHKFIADTIVPWTALWLLFFEEWLISDEWKGGGVHPGEAGKLEDVLASANDY